MRTSLTLVCFLFFSRLVFAQFDAQDVLSSLSFDSALIANLKIRSAHVFLEIYDDNYEQSGNHILTRKHLELEFDNYGNPVYRRSNEITEELFLLGDKGTLYESVKYDDRRRVSENCVQSGWQSYCQYFTYDERGNVLSARTTGQGVSNGTTTFEWKGGKMIRATEAPVSGTTFNFERSYDEKGRVTEIRMGQGRNTTYAYSDNGTEERTVTSTYIGEDLTMRYTVAVLKGSRKATYLCQQNGKLDTLKMLKATYDASQNLVSISSTDYSELYQERKPEPKSIGTDGTPARTAPAEKYVPLPKVDTYRIDNHYADGLLVKRTIYVTKNGYKRDDVPDMIERIVYDKDPLPTKIWPKTQE